MKRLFQLLFLLLLLAWYKLYSDFRLEPEPKAALRATSYGHPPWLRECRKIYLDIGSLNVSLAWLSSRECGFWIIWISQNLLKRHSKARKTNSEELVWTGQRLPPALSLQGAISASKSGSSSSPSATPAQKPLRPKVARKAS